MKCEGCAARTRGSRQLCRACKSASIRGSQRVAAEGLIVDLAGGSWWIWSQTGAVLVSGKDTHPAAILALGRGEGAAEIDPVASTAGAA